MVRTRFAPSPTGYLHLGGVRTALFNWLFARKHGGQFVLRIDDTDQERNVAEALAPILHGLEWLGLDWDEGPEVDGPYVPYYQSQRAELHQQAANSLLEGGFAYWDYSTAEEREQRTRDVALGEKTIRVYDRSLAASSEEDHARFKAEGRTGAVRLKMPRTGLCTFDDCVRGSVGFPWAAEQDHAVQRGDGSCLYHLASVVDDHAMGITHVIRAEEHLSNTPRQIFIARSLGYELPTYAHLPYVAAPGGKGKLSKRKLAEYLKHKEFQKVYQHGVAIAECLGRPAAADTFNPVIVDFYETVGYLPDAVVNYLLLLGWSLDDKTEFFSREEMTQHFSLERVNKAPASFDPAKLQAFQQEYANRLTGEQRERATLPYLQAARLVGDPASDAELERLRAVVQAAAERLTTAGDILQFDDFFRADDAFAYDEKALEKRLKKDADAAGRLAKFREKLAAVKTFDAPTLEAELHAFVESEGIKIGQIIHALRVATTGKAVGFGMFDTLAILGRESCLARIDRTLQRVQAG